MCASPFHTKQSFLVLVLILSMTWFTAACQSPAISTSTGRSPSDGLKEINGTQLFYKTIGNGQPIFFLHGASGSHRSFLPSMEPLADRYQLFFYDQRGTGSSNATIDIKAISIDQFVEDLEALRIAFGFEKISLIGHSRGAIIALFYAFKYQAHVDKLILVDSLPLTNTFEVELNQTLKQRFQRLSPKEQHTFTTVCHSSVKLSPEERMACLTIDATLRFYDPAKAATMDTTLEKNTERNGDTIQSLILTSFNRRQSDIDALLKTLHVPTLIMHGDFDPIPVGASEYMHQHIAASQVVVVKESGHFPFIEQPEQFLAALQGFMRP